MIVVAKVFTVIINVIVIYILITSNITISDLELLLCVTCVVKRPM